MGNGIKGRPRENLGGHGAGDSCDEATRPSVEIGRSETGKRGDEVHTVIGRSTSSEFAERTDITVSKDSCHQGERSPGGEDVSFPRIYRRPRIPGKSGCYPVT